LSGTAATATASGGRAPLRDPLRPGASARRAEALGSRLPPLMVAAERVAATVAQGVHGRRRVGQGDSFWQFRPFLPGDAASRIDWRQSGRSDRAYVRETEWEAAQTVCLWCDTGASMRWRSRDATTEKAERAELLLLALASLLLRGGERVRLIGPAGRTVAGRGGVDRLAEFLALPAHSSAEEGLPPDVKLPRHAQVVLIGDMLAPLERIHATVGRLAAGQATGHLLQVLDPAEALLPYSGRVRFQGMDRVQHALIPRVEGVREAYAKRLAEQQAGLAAICAAAGWGFAVHRTDYPPEAALLSLYTALAPQLGRR
jgi:uncharacterized protein (DUF58 family)